MNDRKYRYIIFDADDTLVDYEKDSLRAFRAALRAIGREDDEKLLKICIDFDYGNWDKVGLSDVHLPTVQAAFHDLYRGHVRDIFAYADKMCGLGGKAAEAERIFLQEFSMPGIEVEGAREVVCELVARGYRVYAATNGLSSLQRSRLKEFPINGIFISEEIGAIKPTYAFFKHVLDCLKARPSECLMVGDSLASDIEGARRAGIDCVGLSRRNAPCPPGVREIKRLKALLDIL